MATAKVNQSGAMGFENGQNHGGFGDFDSRNKLESEAGKPYTSLPLQKEFHMIEDESVTDSPYKMEDQLGRISADNEYNYVGRYTGRTNDYAWGFGFETVHGVVVYKVANDTTEPDIGESFQDDDLNNLSFLRKEEYKDIMDNLQTLFIFSNDDSATIPSSSDSETLTNQDAGDNITTVSSYGNLYEHQFELPRDREQRDFTSEEETALAGLELTDRTRQLYQTFAKKYKDHYLIANSVMAENVNISSSAGEFLNFSHSTRGHNIRIIDKDGNRVDTNESITPVDFSLPCAMKQTSDNISHAQLRAELFEQEDGVNYQESTKEILEVTDLSAEVSFTLDQEQSSASGYYSMEPNLEGHYDISSEITLGRQRGTKFQEWRDNRTHLGARFAWNKGGLMHEIVIKNFMLDRAGADDSAVAKEPIELNIGAVCDTHKFSDWLYSEVYPDSPIVLRTRDDNPENSFAPEA